MRDDLQSRSDFPDRHRLGDRKGGGAKPGALSKHLITVPQLSR